MKHNEIKQNLDEKKITYEDTNAVLVQKVKNFIKEHEQNNKEKCKEFEDDQKKNSDKKNHNISESNDAIEYEIKSRQVNEDISESNDKIKYEHKLG